MENRSHRILLVEDDEMIASGLKYALEQAGYGVTCCGSVAEVKTVVDVSGLADAAGLTAKAAIFDVTSESMKGAFGFDLAILDMNLPDGTGFEARDLLAFAAKVSDAGDLRVQRPAIIFLTVADDEGNIVRAFDEGADDYITKPFRLRELLARVKRTLSLRERKLATDSAVGAGDGEGMSSRSATGAGKSTAAELLHLGKAVIDTSAGRAYIEKGNGDGAQNGGGVGTQNDDATSIALDLTALEYRLLLMFASNSGQLLSRSQILDGIWDASGNFVEDNTLTVYIKRLREKLGDAASIQTVRGLGYRAD
jgi:DNA-binding response OmpR family regulator